MPDIDPIPDGPPGSTFFFGNWQYGLDLGSVVNEAIFVHARASSFDNLGPTDAVRNQQLADIVNRAIQEFMEAVPRVGQAEETIAIAANDNVYPIPTAMMGRQITAIIYSGAAINGQWALAQVPYVSEQALVNLPLSVRQGITTSFVAQVWTYDRNAANILLFPFPATAAEIIVAYQQAPGVITAAMIEDRVETPTLIGEIPTRWQNVLAQRIAAEVIQSIRPDLAAELGQLYAAGIAECQKVFTGLQAANQPFNAGFGALTGPVQFNPQFGEKAFYFKENDDEEDS